MPTFYEKVKYGYGNEIINVLLLLIHLLEK